jgi:hypothetical protein
VGPVEKKENLVGSVECFVFVAKFPNLVGKFLIRFFFKHHKIVIFPPFVEMKIIKLATSRSKHFLGLPLVAIFL